MTNTLLSASGLSRSFGAVRALDGVDISVAAGELLGIIGPNGSGKTTLFNCLTGRLPPDQGRITFGERTITGMPMHKVARLGLLRTFQESRFFVSATTRQNVAMASSLGDRYAPKRHSAWPSPDDILSLMHLTEVSENPASILPFGFQRRLGIAMCVAMRPLLLLLDEPAAGLNAAEGQELGECLRTICAGGVTLGVVDHDMDFLLPLVERVVVLAEGHNVTEGPPAEVRQDPQVLEVYLGRPRDSGTEALEL